MCVSGFKVALFKILMKLLQVKSAKFFVITIMMNDSLLQNSHGGSPAINFAPVFKIMNGGNDFSTDTNAGMPKENIETKIEKK